MENKTTDELLEIVAHYYRKIEYCNSINKRRSFMAEDEKYISDVFSELGRRFSQDSQRQGDSKAPVFALIHAAINLMEV